MTALGEPWEADYNGGRLVISAHGLSVVPKKGAPPVLPEQWEPDFLEVDESRMLGRGACSMVHMGKLSNERTQRPCAVKVFNTFDSEQQKQLEQVSSGCLLRNYSLVNGSVKVEVSVYMASVVGDVFMCCRSCGP